MALDIHSRRATENAMLKSKIFQLWFSDPFVNGKSKGMTNLNKPEYYGQMITIFLENTYRKAKPIGRFHRLKKEQMWRLLIITDFIPRTGSYGFISQEKVKYEHIEEMPLLPDHFLAKMWVRCNFRWLMNNYISPDLLRYIGVEI